MPDFASLSLPVNIALFAAAASVVWFSGVRLARYADRLTDATGVDQALVGLILLAGVTSLPEIAVSVTAAATDAADLAINNLFGSIAMQVAVLAVIDFIAVRRALTSASPDAGLLLLGGLNVLLLALAAAGIVVGDVAFLGVGAWAWASLAAYAFSLWLISQAQGRQPWIPRERRDEDEEAPGKADRDGGEEKELSVGLIVRMAAVAMAILIGGFVVAQSGEAIAEQTGLGSSFAGYVLVAITTSLPEFSTALAAVRLGRFSMAISDILGTNLINIGLIFLVDLVAPGEPVLNQAGDFSVFGALLGIIVTAILVIGIAERRDRTVARMGIDSLALLVVYAGGLAILYTLR